MLFKKKGISIIKYTHNKDGFALAITLIMLFIGSTYIAIFLERSTHEIRLSKTDIENQQSFITAEDGLEYGVLRLKEVIMDYQLSPSWTPTYLSNKLNAIPTPPSIGNNSYTSPNNQSAFKIKATTPIIEGIIPNGACKGSFGSYQLFTITCGAINNNNGYGSVIKQTVQVVGLQLVRFGVFYDEDLEMNPGPNMDFFGPVHVNADMYMTGPLNFYDRLTSHGNVFRHRKDNPNKYNGVVKIADAANRLLNMRVGSIYYDSDYVDFMTKSIERWNGNLMSAAHGVPRLAPPVNPVDDYHDIIERPNTTNTPVNIFENKVLESIYNQKTEDEKFSNKACLKIHIDSTGGFTAIDYHGNDVSSHFINAVIKTNGLWNGKTEYAKGADATYQFAAGGEGSYDITKTEFYDARQKAYMAPVDIYAEELLECFPALYDGTYSVKDGRGIVYVTRETPSGSPSIQPCVRIRNGKDISKSPYGLSIASDLPIYIEGDYNTESTRPALISGDSVTMLSKNWQDSKSREANKNSRRSSNTDYNVVIMTGNTKTSVGKYNGGLENVLRFLEAWSGKTAKFRGSIIDLWYAELDTEKWGSGYYSPPKRNWGYDTIYRTLSPPGMTRVYGMEEIEWVRSTWSAENLDN